MQNFNDHKSQTDTLMKTYKRNILIQNEYFEFVKCEWNSSSISPLHHHEWSQCYVYVESGTFQDSLHLGLKTESNIINSGEAIYTPFGAKHQIKCLSDQGITYHVYLPKISQDNLLEKNIFSDVIKEFSFQLNAEPIKFSQLLSIITAIQQNSISTHSPYFMNQLFSGILPEMYLSENLLSLTKASLATKEASPIFFKIELEIIEKICELINWPINQREGITVPGRNSSNFMALHCARQNKFPEYKNKGMNLQHFKIFSSEDAHDSFKKACIVLGFGLNSLIKIKTDHCGKMDTTHLENEIDICIQNGETPLFVCATAGSAVYGSFDPIFEIANICKKYEIWFHVDAAWGGAALFSKARKYLLEGVHLADSVTFDAHKLFGASLTCSFYLTSHKNLLHEANDVVEGEDLFHQNSSDLDRGCLSWQCDRPADFFSFWTIWKSVGTNGLENFVERLFEIRDQALNWAECNPRIIIVKKPEFLNLCLRILPPSNIYSEHDWSQKVRSTLIEKNLAMVNCFTNSEGTFLRIILANPFLEFNHVKNILEWALEVN